MTQEEIIRHHISEAEKSLADLIGAHRGLAGVINEQAARLAKLRSLLGEPMAVPAVSKAVIFIGIEEVESV